MKILKKAVQKNVMVETSYYTEAQMNEMFAEGKVFKIDEDDVYRVYTEHCSELKVELDKYGYYVTVAVMKDGSKININL